MARIIVNLVSRETTPNFLFIKEMKQKDDELLFITSKIFEERIQWIEKALNLENCHSKPVVLDNGIEEKWSQMVSSIRSHLSDEHQYIVNLTCGTKYMISAVPKAFEGYQAEFFYIPFPKNIILKINDDTTKDIAYRMSVTEYFDCNNTQIPEKLKTTTKGKDDYTPILFEKFTSGQLNMDIIEKIRIGYRNKLLDINNVETKDDEVKKPRIAGLSEFLHSISFPLEKSGFLSKEETVYITGGWFEEYIFSLIKDRINPQDIMIGVDLPITDNKHVSKRDLDVIFTFENKLFVIECKTGIDKESILVETVYKAAALKNERLGKLSASTSIFALNEENEDNSKFKDIAQAMNINYYDKSYFVESDKFQKIIADINKKAKG